MELSVTRASKAALVAVKYCRVSRAERAGGSCSLDGLIRQDDAARCMALYRLRPKAGSAGKRSAFHKTGRNHEKWGFDNTGR